MIKMEKWEIALQKFLKKWENKKEVTGAIVCGSYITGNPNPHSDIDLHILLTEDTDWRERGNKIIDGVLIEYFANPIGKHYEYFKSDYANRRKAGPHMFATGRIIFDKTGDLKKLVKFAKANLNKKYSKNNKIITELDKYRIWEIKDKLELKYENNSEDFYFVYYNHLLDLFSIYSKYLQFDDIRPHKILNLLTKSTDKQKYNISNFPDKEFVKMYVNAINIKDKSKMIKEYQKLTNHVLDKMGGFNIDGWKIKSPAQ